MPTARAIWAMRQTESSTSRAATIMRSFSSSTTMRMNGSRWTGARTPPSSSSSVVVAESVPRIAVRAVLFELSQVAIVERRRCSR